MRKGMRTRKWKRMRTRMRTRMRIVGAAPGPDPDDPLSAAAAGRRDRRARCDAPSSLRHATSPSLGAARPSAQRPQLRPRAPRPAHPTARAPRRAPARAAPRSQVQRIPGPGPIRGALQQPVRPRRLRLGPARRGLPELRSGRALLLHGHGRTPAAWRGAVVPVHLPSRLQRWQAHLLSSGRRRRHVPAIHHPRHFTLHGRRDRLHLRHGVRDVRRHKCAGAPPTGLHARVFCMCLHQCALCARVRACRHACIRARALVLSCVCLSTLQGVHASVQTCARVCSCVRAARRMAMGGHCQRGLQAVCTCKGHAHVPSHHIHITLVRPSSTAGYEFQLFGTGC